MDPVVLHNADAPDPRRRSSTSATGWLSGSAGSPTPPAATTAYVTASSLAALLAVSDSPKGGGGGGGVVTTPGAPLQFPEIAAARAGIELGARLQHDASAAATPAATSRSGVVFCGGRQLYRDLPVYLRTLLPPCAEARAALVGTPVDLVVRDAELLFFATGSSVQPPSDAAATSAEVLAAMRRNRPPYRAAAPDADLRQLRPKHHRPRAPTVPRGLGMTVSPAAATMSPSASSELKVPAGTVPLTPVAAGLVPRAPARAARRGGAESLASDATTTSGVGRHPASAANASGVAIVAPHEGNVIGRRRWMRELVDRYPDGYLCVRYASRAEAAARRVALALLTYDVAEETTLCFESLPTILRGIAARRIARWWPTAAASQRRRRQQAAEEVLPAGSSSYVDRQCSPPLDDDALQAAAAGSVLDTTASTLQMPMAEEAGSTSTSSDGHDVGPWKKSPTARRAGRHRVPAMVLQASAARSRATATTTRKHALRTKKKSTAPKQPTEALPCSVPWPTQTFGPHDTIPVLTRYPLHTARQPFSARQVSHAVFEGDTIDRKAESPRNSPLLPPESVVSGAATDGIGGPHAMSSATNVLPTVEGKAAALCASPLSTHGTPRSAALDSGGEGEQPAPKRSSHSGGREAIERFNTVRKEALSAARERSAAELERRLDRCRQLRRQQRPSGVRLAQQVVPMELVVDEDVELQAQVDALRLALHPSTPRGRPPPHPPLLELAASSRCRVPAALYTAHVGAGRVFRPGASNAAALHSSPVEHRVEVDDVDGAPAWKAVMPGVQQRRRRTSTEYEEDQALEYAVDTETRPNSSATSQQLVVPSTPLRPTSATTTGSGSIPALAPTPPVSLSTSAMLPQHAPVPLPPATPREVAAARERARASLVRDRQAAREAVAQALVQRQAADKQQRLERQARRADAVAQRADRRRVKAVAVEPAADLQRLHRSLRTEAKVKQRKAEATQVEETARRRKTDRKERADRRAAHLANKFGLSNVDGDEAKEQTRQDDDEDTLHAGTENDAVAFSMCVDAQSDAKGATTLVEAAGLPSGSLGPTIPFPPMPPEPSSTGRQRMHQRSRTTHAVVTINDDVPLRGEEDEPNSARSRGDVEGLSSLQTAATRREAQQRLDAARHVAELKSMRAAARSTPTAQAIRRAARRDPSATC